MTDGEIKSVFTKPTQVKIISNNEKSGIEVGASQRIDYVKKGFFGRKNESNVEKEVQIYFENIPDIQFNNIQQIQHISFTGLDKVPKQEFRTDFPFESSLSYNKGCWWLLGKGNDGNVYTALVKSKIQIEIEAKEEAERPEKERKQKEREELLKKQKEEEDNPAETINLASIKCPKCRGEVGESKGSWMSRYINTYKCTKCDWEGLKCGRSGCDGYMNSEMYSRSTSRYQCVKCGWSCTG